MTELKEEEQGRQTHGEPQCADEGPQPRSPMTAERVLEHLRARTVVVDDGPAGRGGYFSHKEPDPVCAEAAGLIQHLIAALDGVRACSDPSQSGRATSEPTVALANADWVAWRALAEVYQDAPMSWAARAKGPASSGRGTTASLAPSAGVSGEGGAL